MAEDSSRLVAAALKGSHRAQLYDTLTRVVLIVLIVLIGILNLHTLGKVDAALGTASGTNTTLTRAIKAGPAAQDAALRQLLGCPRAPARCPNIAQLLALQTAKIDELLQRPVQTRVVVRQGATRTVVITRTVVVTRTICRLPNGRPC